MSREFTSYAVLIHKANGDLIELEIEAANVLDMLEQVGLQHSQHLVNKDGYEVAKIEWMPSQKDEFDDVSDAEFLDKIWEELNKDGRDE